MWKRLKLARRWQIYKDAIPVFYHTYKGEEFRIWIRKAGCNDVYEHVGDLIICGETPIEEALRKSLEYLVKGNIAVHFPEIDPRMRNRPVAYAAAYFQRLLKAAIDQRRENP